MNKVCHDNTIKRALFDVADKVVLATSDKKNNDGAQLGNKFFCRTQRILNVAFSDTIHSKNRTPDKILKVWGRIQSTY